MSAPRKILRIKEVTALTGLSRTTLWRRVKDGSFPQPIRLSRRCVGWFAADVAEWQGSRERGYGDPVMAAA